MGWIVLLFLVPVLGSTGCSEGDSVRAEPQSDAEGAPTERETTWDEWVISADDADLWASRDVEPGSLETLERVNAIFHGRDADCAQAYVDEDLRTIVVNIKVGHEDDVVEEVGQALGLGMAPVRIQPVDHSWNDLMLPALALAKENPELAGARVGTVRVDPVRNALVVHITEVNEQTVNAVHEAFGTETYIAQGEQGSFAN